MRKVAVMRCVTSIANRKSRFSCGCSFNIHNSPRISSDFEPCVQFVHNSSLMASKLQVKFHALPAYRTTMVPIISQAIYHPKNPKSRPSQRIHRTGTCFLLDSAAVGLPTERINRYFFRFENYYASTRLFSKAA